ncbi:MAG: alpha/beta hydrolase [Gammaproteobacteria bacterium]
MKPKLITLFMMLPWLGGCVSYQGQALDISLSKPAYRFQIDQDITYTPADWSQELQADIYQPQSDDPEDLEHHPALLLVHGGGWREGRTRDDMNSIARRLAERGYVVMNISYRFAPEYTFPAQLHDLQQALHWLHDHADRYRIDVNRVGGFGYSAGAHLVALLATVSSGDDLDAPHGGDKTRLKAVVAGGTPTDLRKFDSGRLVRQFLGGTREAIFDIYEQASPVTHVTLDDPPMFLYHGGWDRLVPVDHAEDMHEILQQHSAESELYIDHSRGHISMFLFDDSAITAALAFLRVHLRE